MRREAPKQSSGQEELAGAALSLAAVLFVLGSFGVLMAAHWLDTGHWPTVTDTLVSLFKGDVGWSWWHTVMSLLWVGSILGVLIPVLRWNGRRVAGQEDMDRKADHMGETDGLTREAAQAKSDKAHLTNFPIAPGVQYGTAVRDNVDLWTGWRDATLVVAGPGWGKSTGLVIPIILDAPGVVLATTIRRDVPDAVRLACETRGTFYCFDPMGIADYQEGGTPLWWWNPLRQIKGPVEARALGTIFAEAVMPEGAQKHPYFDTKGPALLGSLLFAAAVGGFQLPKVYEWLADPDDREPIEILRLAGHRLSSMSLAGAYKTDAGEKSGLFGTAGNAVEWMNDPKILEWITDDGTRPEFDPDSFVRSKRDTLIALSKEDDGSAAALTTALTVTVTKAAERYAMRLRGGRMDPPMVAALDEIVNVAPWQRLPKLFSHYGGTGISLFAFTQNWSQGVTAWKHAGMQALWDAATVRIVGGGLADESFLGRISKLTGQRWIRKTSSQDGQGRGSTTVGPDREFILDIDELGALDPGKFVVFASGEYAVLGETRPWWRRPEMVAEVEASKARYEPVGVNP